MGNKSGKMSKTAFEAKYSVKEVLGKGSFAKVKRCIRRSDKSVLAVKIIPKKDLSQAELAIVNDEVTIMTKIDNPNCVRLFDLFETKKKLYLVMEFLQGGELFESIVQLEKYSEKEAAEVIRSVASALKYLHGIGIVHRDLKPENLIYAKKNPYRELKVTDFGLAKLKKRSEMLTTACGTPGYVAPEVLKKQEYNEAVDVWSLGVILYILLCGFPPFYHEQTQKLYALIKAGDYQFPHDYWKDITDSAKELIRKMLTVDPKKRITVDQILQHPWVQGRTASAQAFGPGHSDRLRKLQARRQLRKVVQMIIAINRFARFLDSFKKKPIT